MRCLSCNNFSISLICKKCQQKYLTPTIKKKILPNNLEVFSFYEYDEIKDLLLTKHTIIGSGIYNILAKNSFRAFAKNFHFDKKIYSIAIDDNTKSGYSHTAILNKALKSKNITPLFHKLLATNRVNYSGQSLDFRLKNPRNFIYKGKENISAILVDDILTTGTTLSEAFSTLKKHNVEVLFALVLANV